MAGIPKRQKKLLLWTTLGVMALLVVWKLLATVISRLVVQEHSICYFSCQFDCKPWVSCGLHGELLHAVVLAGF
jgi:hypothetical protein